MNKKDINYIWIVIILFISLISISLDYRYMFGNSINYFIERSLLINYKLFNPLIVLYKFIRIDGYFNILSVISIGISIFLLYYLFNKKNNKELSIIVISYLIINSILVNNMFNSISDILILPYIIMCFIGVKLRIESNNMIILSMGILLVSISNYSYILPLIICLIIYSIYLYLINNRIIFIFKFIKHIIKIMIPILCGLLLSSFILLKYIDNISIDYSLNYNFKYIYLFSIIYSIFKDKKNFILCICLILCSIFLNKYYLCYLVLYGIIIFNLFKDIKDRNVNLRIYIIGIILSIIYGICYKEYMYIIEMFLLYIGIMLYHDKRNIIYLVIFSLLSIYSINIKELLDNNYIRKDINIEDYINYDQSNIFDNMLNSRNIINNNMIGYKKYKDGNKYYYRNDDVLPVGFSNSSLISYEDYNKLNGLEKEEVKINSIVADIDSHNEYVSYVKDIKIDKDSYDINIKDNRLYTFKLDDNNINKIIYIEFRAKSNKCNNNIIKINNIIHEIDCEYKIYKYILSDKNIDSIYVNISKGKYSIKDIKVYSLDYARIENSKLFIDEYIYKLINNEYNGYIDVTADGFFMINLEYNNNYEILVDGIKNSYQKVDDKYIGFPISKGRHNIIIRDNFNNILISWFFTYLGLVFMFCIYYVERLRKFI